jgi:class 3 adenylate cyclase
LTVPAGTVTFLFSAIEGSTRLLEQLGDRYGEVHRDHRRILREALTAAGSKAPDLPQLCVRSGGAKA